MCSLYLICGRPYISSFFCLCFNFIFEISQFHFAHVLLFESKPRDKQENFNDPLGQYGYLTTTIKPLTASYLSDFISVSNWSVFHNYDKRIG